SPTKGAAFSGVCATVIKLTPSPRVPGALMDCALDEISMKRIFAAAAQCASAWRAAPTTSLPGLMFDCAVMSEVESAILIVCVGHLICTELEASVNWSV